MERWSGRVALVTGASVGIGAAIAEVLVKHGMKVVGCARNVESIQEMSESLSREKGKLYAKRCDLTKEEDILSMFQEIRSELGGVDVCINNAGVVYNAPLLTGEFLQWKDMLDVHVLSLTLCTKETVKCMQERKVDDGHIIHISSNLGLKVVPNPAGHFYSATKHAVRALTEGHRNELRQMDSNIRVSSISPGLVKTEAAARMSGEEVAKQIYESKPVHDIIVRPTKQIP